MKNNNLSATEVSAVVLPPHGPPLNLKRSNANRVKPPVKTILCIGGFADAFLLKRKQQYSHNFLIWKVGHYFGMKIKPKTAYSYWINQSTFRSNSNSSL